jgi:imidazolonepropionase-like amidohydrolase/dipeptidyl aminopeptidase/acylaminoacyl peptidase
MFGNAAPSPGEHMRVSILAVTAIAFLVLPVSTAEAQEGDRRTIEFETSQVTESDVTVSPDGRWLVFSVLGHLYRLPVEGGTAEQLTFGPYMDADPVFSPDGRMVAFVSDRDGSDGNVFVFAIETREINQISRDRWAARPSWSPDARTIAYLQVLPDSTGGDWPAVIPTQVRWVGLEDGGARTLDGPARQFRSTFFLSDGSIGWSVVEQDPASGRRSSRIESLHSDGTVSVLRTVEGLVDRVVPAPDGEGLYCHQVQEVYPDMLAVTQPAHLAFVPLPEGEVRSILPLSETSRFYWFGRPRFAVDGAAGRVFLADAGRLWAISAFAGTRMPVEFTSPIQMAVRNPAVPVPFEPPLLEVSRPPRAVLDPILAPDGSSLVFEATGDLWIQDNEAGPARRLLEGPGLEWLASFSSDGRWVAFVQDVHGLLSLMAFDRETGEVQTLLSGGEFVYPAWSPDGRRVIFSGPAGVTAVRLHDGGTEQLTDMFLARPHFSGDGRYLYGTEGDVVYRLLLEGDSQPEPLTQLTGSVTEGIVSPNGRWLVFGRDLGIWVSRLGSEPVNETVISRLTAEGEGDFSLSGDGTAVAYAVGNRVWRQPIDGSAAQEIPVRLTLHQATPPPLLLHGIRLLDFESGVFGSETDLLIADGRISRIGPEADTELPDDAVILNAAGRFAIPGLFDMHVHASGADLVGLMAYGGTSLRDVGGDVRFLSTLADRSEYANGPLPRLFYSGDILGGEYIGSEAEARDCVRRWKQGGARFIKVYSTLSQPLQQAAAEEARLQGLPVVAHGTNVSEIVRGVNAGYFSLEHTALSSRFYDDVFGLLAAAGTRWTPTLAVRGGNAMLFRFEPERLAGWKLRALNSEQRIGAAQGASWVRSVPDKLLHGLVAELLDGVGAAHERGVRLLAGTDIPACPECFTGVSLHWELELLVRAGLTPLEVLRIATLDAAATVGAEADLGTLEVGRLADMVLLDANPLEDIRNTQRVWRVIKGGWVFDPEALRPERN